MFKVLIAVRVKIIVVWVTSRSLIDEYRRFGETKSIVGRGRDISLKCRHLSTRLRSITFYNTVFSTGSSQTNGF
jgi:hypothetical protein